MDDHTLENIIDDTLITSQQHRQGRCTPEMHVPLEKPAIQLIALGNGVWLDEIRREGHEPIKDVPGGSVTFATLGARLFTPNNPRSIAMSFNAGSDFPDSIIDTFRSWHIDLDVRHHNDKPSSRGLVFYEKANNNRKGFQRLTDPLPVTVADLQDASLLATDAFEFFGTAEYVEEQVFDIRRLRKKASDPQTRPFIVWEPHAKSCLPETLKKHQHAARLVNIFSPNHEELHSFFGQPSSTVDPELIEKQARAFLDAGIGATGDGGIVVRAAENGCLVMSKQQPTLWLPPYYPADSESVVDPTGAGNAFLGAFAVSWHRTGSYDEAAMYGTVAASFALEQVGLPMVTGQGDDELWNGHNVQGRLSGYQQRLSG